MTSIVVCFGLTVLEVWGPNSTAQALAYHTMIAVWVSLTLVFFLSGKPPGKPPGDFYSNDLIKPNTSQRLRLQRPQTITFPSSHTMIGALVTFLLLCRDTASYVFLLFSRLQFLIAPDDWTYDVKGCCEVLGGMCCRVDILLSMFPFLFLKKLHTCIMAEWVLSFHLVSPRLNPGHQVRHQTPLLAESSHWPFLWHNHINLGRGFLEKSSFWAEN